MYQPSKKILEKYADVLVNFALWWWKWIKAGDVVWLSVPEIAKPFFLVLYSTILKAGGHVIVDFMPDGLQKIFYDNASVDQIQFCPKSYEDGLCDSCDHWIRILSEHNLFELEEVDPKKFTERKKTRSYLRNKFFDKEYAGKFSWNLAIYGTPAMAKEAGLSEKEYRDQIIKACFLDYENPVEKRKETYDMMTWFEQILDDLAPKILHFQWEDVDLHVGIGKQRKWLSGRGANIPSFEIFTSPDWRETKGWIRFNQPLYLYWQLIEGIELRFEKWLVVKSKATKNHKLLLEILKIDGADRIGEISLTDKRCSKIDKFMADTLYDENFWWKFGNMHLALGKAFKDAYAWDFSQFQQKDRDELWFNVKCTEHKDIVSTSDRVVFAEMDDGSRVKIYEGGEFLELGGKK